ncbi:MAG: hypothetical protein H7232_11265, partial [Aeromicrobium sp.]|nr:hypothetical protein [Burkholderiales bacterium]
TVIAANLEDPRGLALDNAGRFLVSDAGDSHQVKIFDATGKFVRVIGKAGAPRAGAYDPLHMNHPDGITVDSREHLWVAENDILPRRVSVWKLDGTFVDAFYGPSEYGGGGRLDPTDKTRFYYGGMEFKLDWQKGKDRLVNILYRPQVADGKLANIAPPEMPLYHNGRRFFTNDFNGNPTNGSAVVYLFAEKDGIVRPIAGMGRANDWDVLKGEAFKPNWPVGVDLKGNIWQDAGKNQTFFIWNDLNGDAQPQPKEVVWKQAMSGGITVMPDLAFVVSRIGSQATRFKPTFDTEGRPQYDLAKGEVLVSGMQGPQSSGGDQVLAGENGWTIATLGITPFHSHSVSGAKNGVPLWSYPNVWPGLHASHEAAKPDRPGQVIGATRMLGGFIKPQGSDAGEIWGVNGNMGNLYLFTSDGLFVATLFEDVRQGKLWQMPVAMRNMKLDGITLHDENFWPSLTQTPDGQIYVVDGSNSVLVRVDGLDSIRRLPDSTIRVGPEDLRKAQAWQLDAEAERQQASGSGVLMVKNRAEAPVIDGKIDEWAGAAWVDIDKSGIGANFNSNSKPYDISGVVSISGDRLYAAWQTGNKDLLKNSGENLIAPFKTGGALDLMVGATAADSKRSTPVEGDVRLLVTRIKDKTFALLYRAVVPGTKTPTPFSSPWRTINLDRVDDVSTQVQLAGADGNYEISIPLEALGLKPQTGQTIKGDLGVLRGDGTQTLSRMYWSNKATAIVSDVPSEAMLTPNLWGDWKFE